jgi:hypothetical protein
VKLEAAGDGVRNSGNQRLPIVLAGYFLALGAADGRVFPGGQGARERI